MTHDFERAASMSRQPKRRARSALALGVGTSWLEKLMEDQTPAPSASRIPRAVKPTVIRRFQSAGRPRKSGGCFRGPPGPISFGGWAH